MGRRVAAAGPVAVSLLVHGALAAGIVAALSVAVDTPRRREQVVPVSRVPESGAARPLVLEEVPDGAVPLDTDDPRFHPYLRGVKDRIVARWEIPGAAAGGGGPVVEFVISGDGSLAACDLAGGATGAAAVAAALAAVRRAAPFPPLPPGIGRESLRVRARFVP